MACRVCGAIATKVCTGCRVARYCGVACQRVDWPDWHRNECKATAKDDGAQSSDPAVGRQNAAEAAQTDVDAAAAELSAIHLDEAPAPPEYDVNERFSCDGCALYFPRARLSQASCGAFLCSPRCTDVHTSGRGRAHLECRACGRTSSAYMRVLITPYHGYVGVCMLCDERCSRTHGKLTVGALWGRVHVGDAVKWLKTEADSPATEPIPKNEARAILYIASALGVDGVVLEERQDRQAVLHKPENPLQNRAVFDDYPASSYTPFGLGYRDEPLRPFFNIHGRSRQIHTPFGTFFEAPPSPEEDQLECDVCHNKWPAGSGRPRSVLAECGRAYCSPECWLARDKDAHKRCAHCEQCGQCPDEALYLYADAQVAYVLCKTCATIAGLEQCKAFSVVDMHAALRARRDSDAHFAAKEAQVIAARRRDAPAWKDAAKRERLRYLYEGVPDASLGLPSYNPSATAPERGALEPVADAPKVPAAAAPVSTVEAKGRPRIECPVCADREADHALVDCGHMFCAPCIDALKAKTCPTCRARFIKRIRIFFP